MSIPVLIPVLCLAIPTGRPALPAPAESPAELRMRAARGAIEAEPEEPASYNELALALARRARETADPVYYAEAERALRRSLELAPGNYEAVRTEVWVLLGQHEFERALAAARELNQRSPDDLVVYGYLVDACVELGLYAEAETACQWMLDLRPGAVAGLTRAAYLRELFGDLEGAAELMISAYGILPANEVEERAWVLTQLASLELALETPAGLGAAESALAGALQSFPDYHYALKQLARVRQRQGRPEDALDLLRRRFELAPHPENRFDLAEALLQAGRDAEAAAELVAFERDARAEMDACDNANGELVRYYLEPRFAALRPAAFGPAEALRIAEREARRHGNEQLRVLLCRAQLAMGRADEARATAQALLASGLGTKAVLDLAAELDLDPAGSEEAPVVEPAGKA